MSIRVLLFSVVGMLAATAGVTSGLLAYDAWLRHAAARAVAQAGPVGHLLLVAAGHWAVERGVTNTALAAPSAAPAETRGMIAERREQGDAALAAARERLAAVADFPGRASALAAVETAHAAVQELRRRADQALAVAQPQRDPELAESWIPTLTALIQRSQDLRLALERAANSTDMTIAHLAEIQHFAWVMSEFAGRERALVGATISAGVPLDAERLRALGEFRGRVELAWEMIRGLAAGTAAPPAVRASVATVETGFFTGFEPTRQAVYAAGVAGRDYPFTQEEWIRRSTAAIDTLLALQAAATEAVQAQVAAQSRGALRGLAAMAVLLGGVGAIALASLLMVRRRILGPVRTLTEVMGTLASGDTRVEIPALARRDEIGAMAAAVQVFKENAIERERLAAVQREQEAARERRVARIDALIRDFDREIAGVLEVVGAAAAELDATSRAMAGAAEESSRRAVTVAGAAEQASGNVQTAAAASEELAA